MDKTDHPFTLDGEMPGADAKDIPADAGDKTVAAVLGEIVWLMSQSKEHRHLTVADIETMVMPPILLKQFRIFYKRGQPIAAVLYARTSKSVADRWAEGSRAINTSEWNCGSITITTVVISLFDHKDDAASASNQETM